MHCKYNYLLISTQITTIPKNICYFGVIRNQKSQKIIRSESDHQLYEQNGKKNKKKNHFHQNLKQHKYTTNLFSRFDKIIVNSFLMNARHTNLGGDKMWLFVICLSKSKIRKLIQFGKPISVVKLQPSQQFSIDIFINTM